VDFNASDLASGVYFYQMTQHGQTLTRKLVLMK
ncbi:MAG TPA: T9SS type A sorting domain-containing protein, partial [Candidatus Marinimicrobia bacterium]|nr:T9SS type A sorting domain-containing protein [Candidatus Neomarinimicrobiota bacterium]